MTVPPPAPASSRPARIACFFSTSGHSGVDRLARHLIPALAGRGYAVDLLKVRRHGPDLDDPPPGVSIIDLGSRHTYGAVPGLVRYLRRTRPAVLLSDKDRVNRTALLARVLARVLAGPPTPLVFRLGTTVSQDLAARGLLERWVKRASLRWLYGLAARVIVPSQGAAADLAACSGLAPARIRVVPSPVVPEDLGERAWPRPEHPWFADPDCPLLLGVGELSARKDFATLIRALALVRRRRPCRLLILGEGGARASLLALAGELRVAEAVDLPGFVPAPYPYLAHADLLVSSSRWEGLSFVLIEALALGTPVVATDCPSGPAEILQHGRYGTLVPVGDAEALAAAIEATLDRPRPAPVLREAARPYRVEAAATAYLEALGLPSQVGTPST